MKHRFRYFRAISSLLVTLAATCNALELTVAWSPTTENVDGTPANVTQYRLYYGTSPGTYDHYVDVENPNATLSGLEFNKNYYFAVKAYVENYESSFSGELAWTSPLMPDSDGDTMSDDWELQYVPSLSRMRSGTDLDNDGFSDQEEFVAGSNPSDPQDFPVLDIHPTATGTAVSFEARMASGEGYQNRTRYVTLMQCDNLSSNNWVPVEGYEDIPAGDQIENFEIDISKAGMFFRTTTSLL